MKRQLLFACAALLGMSSWAQTDVTSTYLDNAGFDEAGDFITTGVCTYAKDVAANSADGSSLMPVTAWTAGDSGDAKAGAAFAFGSDAFLTGTAFHVPAENYDGNVEGGALGLGGCWDGNAFYTQELKQPLAPGSYKIEVCCYNAGTATAFGTPTIGIMEEGGATHYVSTTWTAGAWTVGTVSFDITEETAATFYLGATKVSGGSAASAKLFVDYVKITKGLDLSPWNDAKTNAENVAGAYAFDPEDTEMSGLFDAVMAAYDVADPTSADQMNTMVQTLNDAVAAFKTLGDNRLLEQTKAGLTSAINRIKAEYPYTSESLFSTEISKWPGSTYVANNGGEHWSGVKTNYYEQTGAQWGQDSWSISASKTVTLPAGKYAFVVTARASVGTTSIMTVDGEEIELSHVGAAGWGVATDGEATYNLNKTYATAAGRGWEYAYAEFEVESEREVTISFDASANAKQNWVSIANPVLYYDETAKAAMDITNAKAELADAMAAVTVPTANIGVPFGYKTAAVSGIPAELEVAQDILDNGDDLEAINAEIEQMNNAKDYLASEDAKIAPAEGQKFNLVLTFEGWGYDNKAVTYIANGRADAGLYNIQYLAEATGNYAQAFTMTQVEGGYKMSQIDADGEERFVCTGVVYGGNASQIRTTTNADEALVVKVIPTAVEGKFNLWNTEANNYIGSQDAGFYTVNSHIDFNIVEAAEIPGITIGEAGYATYVAPVDVELPEGVKAYTVDGVEGTTLTLTEVSSVAANTPVVLEGAATAVATGKYATVNPAATTVEAGLLTGVYAATAAPALSYVLQSHDGVTAFYLVEDFVPTLPANKCYMTVVAEDAPEAKAFYFGNATAIKAVEALTAGKAQIFDLNGRQQSKLQKGINIVNGVKVLVK